MLTDDSSRSEQLEASEVSPRITADFNRHKKAGTMNSESPGTDAKKASALS